MMFLPEHAWTARLIFIMLIAGVITSFAVVGYLVMSAEDSVERVKVEDGLPTVRADRTPARLPPPS